jgi:hypothetical protein
VHQFWDIVVKPITEALRPSVIVEIGVNRGGNTKNILSSFRDNTVLHAIDPSPNLDVDEWLEAYGEALVFHKDTSLAVIPLLPEFQLGIIDGDHNWYTVFNELRLISALHDNVPGRFPVLLLHDIGWPYGRRDLYYGADRIPEEYRHPSARKGIRWGESGLAAEGGLNAHLDNALREGGDRNGVLTAIEDFLCQSSIDFEFLQFPAYFGLGILLSKETRRNCPRLNQVLGHLTSSQGLMSMMGLLEEIRAKSHIQQQEVLLELRRAETDLGRTRRGMEKSKTDSN